MPSVFWVRSWPSAGTSAGFVTSCRTRSMNPCRVGGAAACRHQPSARSPGSDWITHDLHRARLPLEIYPISAGVKGGLAGSVAMAVLAMLYGVVGQHSIWYPDQPSGGRILSAA